jgi:phytoene dehydrogenase-like protein
MTDKSIIIIGAGIAGLAAGCYGQMNGYKTQIFELHTLPGGLCTAWKRKDYTIDGCIHWLVGSGANSSYNKLWRELGAVQSRKMVDHEIYISIRAEDGKTLNLYTDPDRLEKHLKELSPIDAPLIEEFTKAIRDFRDFEPPLDNPDNLIEGVKFGLKALPAFSKLNKWSNLTIKQFGQKFKDPFIRKAMEKVYESMGDFPALGLVMPLAYMAADNAGYPIGGSLEFSKAIENRYLELGGQIHYKARIVKVLVENDTAVGVCLEDGREFRADVIVSAADGHATIFDMLGGKYINDEIRGYYDNFPIFQPCIQVSLGVDRDFSNEPHAVTELLDEPVTIAGEKRYTIGYRHMACDPTVAPKNKSLVITMLMSNYAYWKQFADDQERYDAEKQEAAVKVMQVLEKHYPGITGQVEMVDVATPLTTERYTGNWQGSIEGWMLTKKTMSMMFRGGMKKTLPGLKNFYMIGQWVEPGGGVPTAGMSGRKFIAQMCKTDHKKFITTEA